MQKLRQSWKNCVGKCQKHEIIIIVLTSKVSATPVPLAFNSWQAGSYPWWQRTKRAVSEQNEPVRMRACSDAIVF